jgi:hypothetical protein
VSESKLRQHGARRRKPEVVDQVLAQQAHCDRVDQQDPLSSETDDSTRFIELQQLSVIQVLGAQQPSFEWMTPYFILIGGASRFRDEERKARSLQRF